MHKGSICMAMFACVASSAAVASKWTPLGPKVGNFLLSSKADPMTDEVSVMANTPKDEITLALTCVKGDPASLGVFFVTDQYLGSNDQQSLGGYAPRLFQYRIDAHPPVARLAKYDENVVSFRVRDTIVQLVNSFRDSSKLAVQLYDRNNRSSHTQVFDMAGIDQVLGRMTTECGLDI